MGGDRHDVKHKTTTRRIGPLRRRKILARLRGFMMLYLVQVEFEVPMVGGCAAEYSSLDEARKFVDDNPPTSDEALDLLSYYTDPVEMTYKVLEVDDEGRSKAVMVIENDQTWAEAAAELQEEAAMAGEEVPEAI